MREPGPTNIKVQSPALLAGLLIIGERLNVYQKQSLIRHVTIRRLWKHGFECLGSKVHQAEGIFRLLVLGWEGKQNP